MQRRIAIALILLTAAASLPLAGVARAQVERDLTTTPAQAPSADAGRRPATATDVAELTEEIRLASRMAAVFSCLALVGVLWVGWSQRAIARNQVELAALIQDVGRRGD
ncbi:MAG TPA: hypothetical protein VFJ30_13565 [Phycisphaerae bacterium]|nr:hypothetical protein [Phycisphaerae bacterium]